MIFVVREGCHNFMFVIDQYVGGGQVIALISGGGREGPQAGGDGTKKLTLCSSHAWLEKGNVLIGRSMLEHNCWLCRRLAFYGM